MIKFNAIGDKLILSTHRSVNSGSYGYYTLEFTFDEEWEGLIPHIVVIENGVQRADEVIVDNVHKLTTTEGGIIMIGVYGLDSNGEKCLSSDYECIEVKKGAYTGGYSMPKDIWDAYQQVIVGYVNRVEEAQAHGPIIGTNGNWHLWDVTTGSYKDTGINASGSGGTTDKAAERLQYYGSIDIYPSPANLFTFSFDEDNLTATIKKSTGTGRVAVPYQYEKDGKIYKVTNIDNLAFRDNTGLSEIIIPYGVIELGGATFYGCSALKKAVLPDGITSLDVGVFGECVSLTDINIPKTVINIREDAFLHCYGLKSINIPVSVTNLENYAFRGVHIENVYYEGSKSQWNKIYIGFGNFSGEAEIHFNTYMVDEKPTEHSNNLITSGGVYDALSNFHLEEYAKKTEIPDVSNFAAKTIIDTLENTLYVFEFSNTHNTEKRLAEVTSISFTFGDGEYVEDYMSGLSFDSGEIPTSIDYADSGILNWVGTDCVTSSGLSIFQPSANTHYDIVFYFNGVQFIGLVNGFVPAAGNVVSE